METADKILILDFCSHYTQLIASTIREFSVLEEIRPSDISVTDLMRENPKEAVKKLGNGMLLPGLHQCRQDGIGCSQCRCGYHKGSYINNFYISGNTASSSAALQILEN